MRRSIWQKIGRSKPVTHDKCHDSFIGHLEAGILIVDDQEANIALLEQMLREAGYVPSRPPWIRTGLRAASQEPYP